MEETHIVSMVELALSQPDMREWGPFGTDEGVDAVFSVGNPCEGHGPALPRDIDDRVAKSLAVEASNRTGAHYCGHVPYTSDRVGEIARDWSPLWVPEDEMVDGMGHYIRDYIERHGLDFQRVLVVNGHGGNNFLGQREEELRHIAGIGIEVVIPFAGMDAGHADTPEHSVAAYLGLVDSAKLEDMNSVIERDPKEALSRWPPIGGLGGYLTFGGDRYAELQKKEYGLTRCLDGFLSDRRIVADPVRGHTMYDRMLEAVCDRIGMA